LAKQLEILNKAIAPLCHEARYVDVLSQLADLRKPVDDFFEKVMVMADDKAQRENRLLLLEKLRTMFLRVADIALLQTR
jgi:glycyl-tRNA synthetase beta chain